jgi:hypothetical protein
MSEPTLVCPHCKEEIKLTESLAAPILEAAKRDHAAALKEKDDLLEAAEERAQAEVKNAKKAALEEAKRDAKSEVADELRALESDLQERSDKLAETQKAQAGLLRRQRELEDAAREMDLTIETRVQESLRVTREAAERETEERLGLRVREKEETIASMQKQIEELRRKAEQGSQQMQGEVLELQLEESLKEAFIHDSIQPVPKGVHGGDVIQKVQTPEGKDCGSIIWESKRTKAWSDGWLSKLRGDQRSAKADIAVILSQALPKGVETFDFIDGVWVISPNLAVPIATMLRQTLMMASSAKMVREGMKTKAELVYEYLTGAQFRQRVEAIVEGFTTMQSDLDKERKAITKQWSKREAQINRVMDATVGMYGDLQGIAGRSVQEIEGLDLKALTE